MWENAVIVLIVLGLPIALLITAGVVYLTHERKAADKHVESIERQSRRFQP